MSPSMQTTPHPCRSSVPGDGIAASWRSHADAGAMDFCLRCLKVSSDVFRRQGPAEGLDDPYVRGLLRELGVDADGPSDRGDLFASLDARLAESAAQMAHRPRPMRELAEGVARAFGYDQATSDLLELAMHANRHRPLRKVLSLFDEVDEEDAADVFGEVLGHDRETIIAALRRDIPFRSAQPFDAGFMRGMSLYSYLAFDRAAARALQGESPTPDALLSMFFRNVPPPRLALDDYASQATEVEMLLQYLRRTMASGRRGANVLLHGAPGTGKTELVRVVGSALEANLAEVPIANDDNDPLPPRKRLAALAAAQDVLRTQDSALLLFDEVEDVFPCDDGPEDAPRGRGHRDRNKGWLTRLLEDNPRPVFWVCNRISQIDPAFLRRFDFIMELSVPEAEVRARIVGQAFAGTRLGEEKLEALRSDSTLAPAHLVRMGEVLRMLEPSCEASAGAMMGILERNTRKALGLPPARVSPAGVLPYRPECVNASVDAVLLADSIAEVPQARLCLYGPPGTGKTAWARQLAGRIGRPLHVVRASDLLGKYVGESERRIRRAFDRAAREEAVLLLDEADSLLHDRGRAQRSWEVSSVNEVLTSMESFGGVFIASTNLRDRLDEASARRFDFKVEFGYLKPFQAWTLFTDLLESFGLEGSGAEQRAVQALRALVPGDFANVYRQARVMTVFRNSARLVELLAGEQAGRRGANTRRIGFV